MKKQYPLHNFYFLKKESSLIYNKLELHQPRESSATVLENNIVPSSIVQKLCQ